MKHSAVINTGMAAKTGLKPLTSTGDTKIKSFILLIKQVVVVCRVG